ncbi:MAG: hypothetical protein ABSA44_05045 [Bacteroidota bacterium]|jgi:hypothetical protein
MKKLLANRKENKKTWIVFIALLMIFSTHSIAQIQTDVPALKSVYAKDFYIGCLLSYAHIGFTSDPEYTLGSVVDAKGGYLIKYHMNSMSLPAIG